MVNNRSSTTKSNILETAIFRSSHPEVIHKKDIFCNFIKMMTSVQVFASEFY